MNIDPVAAIVAAIITAVAGTFLYRMAKFGGFKAAVFGARIRTTVGEVEAPGQFMKMSIRVHVLEGAPEKAVGLELVTKSVGSYQMMPISFSAADAKRLASLIQSAANER